MYERCMNDPRYQCMIIEEPQSFFDKLLKRKKFKIKTNGRIEDSITGTFKFLIFKNKAEYDVSERKEEMQLLPYCRYAGSDPIEIHKHIMSLNLTSHFYLFDLSQYDIVINTFDRIIQTFEDIYRTEKEKEN